MSGMDGFSEMSSFRGMEGFMGAILAAPTLGVRQLADRPTTTLAAPARRRDQMGQRYAQPQAST